MYVIKRKTMFENYTDSLFNDKIILKSQQINFDDYANENKTEHNQKWP